MQADMGPDALGAFMHHSITQPMQLATLRHSAPALALKSASQVLGGSVPTTPAVPARVPETPASVPGTPRVEPASLSSGSVPVGVTGEAPPATGKRPPPKRVPVTLTAEQRLVKDANKLLRSLGDSLVEAGGCAVKLRACGAVPALVGPLETESQSHAEALRSAHTELLGLLSSKTVADDDLARFSKIRDDYNTLRLHILRLTAPTPKPKAKAKAKSGAPA
jgi:hypothetical protein